MSKASNVIEFYILCNKLKTLIRKGWQVWEVNADRLESVAEHIYSTQMLAIAMYSEYNYKIDLFKVIVMLAVHEMEEIIIKDKVYYEITPEEKLEIGHAAIKKILSPLEIGSSIENIIKEFDAKETREAKFAYFCDKLECDLQCKLYDIQGYVDVDDVDAISKVHDPKVKELLDSGASWSDMWLSFSENSYGYDKNFLKVSHEARKLTKKKFTKIITDDKI